MECRGRYTGRTPLGVNYFLYFSSHLPGNLAGALTAGVNLAYNRFPPVIGTHRAADFMVPGDLAIREMHVFQMGKVRVRRILAVEHVVLDFDDDCVEQDSGEIMFLGASSRGAHPVDSDFVQQFSASEGVLEQRRSLVEYFGDDDGMMHALAGGLPRLKVPRDGHLVLEALHHDLVFSTHLKNITDRIGRECTGRDQTLFDAFDHHVCGGSQWELSFLDNLGRESPRGA